MGVFDILPGLGGDGEAGDAEPPDDSGGSGGDAGDQVSLAELGPGDFRERAEALAARSDVPTLDFTVDSLDRLDELAAGPPSAVDDTVAYGSFLGEIVVHEYGGEWTDEDGWQVAVDLPDGETTIAVFDAAEMSIAEEPVFVKVVDHLEAQGAERTPDVSDDPPTDAGAEAVDAGQESSAEPDEPAGADGVDREPDASVDEGSIEPAGGEAADAAATDTDADADTDTDTVVVDDPVTEPDGPDSDDGTDADEATDGVATTAGVSADRDGVSGGDGASATSGVATDRTELDDGPSPDHSFDADAVDDTGPAPHRPADSELTDPGPDPDPDADSGEELSSPAPTDAAATDETNGEADSDEDDANADVDDAGEEDADADSGLLSSSVLPFGGGAVDADGADSGDAGADSGGAGERDESDGDTTPEPTDDAPTADRDDAGPAAASPAGAAADDVDGVPDDDAPDADAATGDAAVDDAEDPAPFVPDSADTGYSPTEYSTDDPESGADGDDEPAVADESDDADDDEPTMSISEQIAALGDDVAEATDADDAGPDGDDADPDSDGDAPDDGAATGDAAAGSEPRQTGQADDAAVDGPGGDADVDTPDDADEARTDDSAGTAGMDTAAPERYVLRRAAEELADGWPERDLDFTAESLPRLDTFVDEQWDGRFRASSLENRTVHHEESGDPLVQLGAYYGEVLIRWLDGEWVATDDGEGAIEVPDVGERVERVDVFEVARECLVPPSTFAYRYDALVNRLHVDEPAVSDGRPDVFDDDRDTLTSGDVITQFAATAETVVEEWEKYPLDYSPRSVRALEEIVDRMTRDVELTDVSLADGTDPESLWLTARATSLGAYFAAVLLRHRDAQWRIDGDDVELVIDRPDGERTVDPVATAAAALRGEASFVDTYTALDD